MEYHIAPTGWTCSDPNPFSPDGSYDPSWRAFCILDQEDDYYFTGKVQNGPFSARLGRGVNHLQKRLADFIRYENSHRHNLILAFPADIDPDPYIAQAQANTPPSHQIRPEDPAIIVHSTTPNAWDHIRQDGCLKAASQLPQHPHMQTTQNLSDVERYLRDEPGEYKDYIMFGDTGSTTPERVTASYQTGNFATDDTVYIPGVRLYFDNHAIIRDHGLCPGKDIAVVGFDNIKMGRYSNPSLTTIDYDQQWRARKMVEILLARIDGAVLPAQHCVSKCRLVKRESA